MSRYRFALRPWWIVSHVFVLLCVLSFVRLGFWQLSRMHERADENALTAARAAMAPAPFDDLVPPGTSSDATSAVVLRRALATGTYRADEQVLIRNRTANESPGYWVVTPLATSEGRALLVNRGWVPLATGDDPDRRAYAPPTGTVTVTGLVRPTQVQEGIGPADPSDGTLAVLSRVDVGRIDQQVAEALAPVYLDLQHQDPAQPTTLPIPVPPPELDGGPHLSYSAQWFAFAALTLVVYALILRRNATKQVEAIEVATAAVRDPEVDDDAGRPAGETVLLGPRRAGKVRAATVVPDAEPEA